MSDLQEEFKYPWMWVNLSTTDGGDLKWYSCQSNVYWWAFFMFALKNPFFLFHEIPVQYLGFITFAKEIHQLDLLSKDISKTYSESLLNLVDRKASGQGMIVLEFGSDPDQGFPLLNDNCCFVLGITLK